MLHSERDEDYRTVSGVYLYLYIQEETMALGGTYLRC